MIEEAAGVEDHGFQCAMTWPRWGWPLPERSVDPSERGERLGWTALQMRWTREADRRPITPMTPPDEVFAFIDEMPGLANSCEWNPRMLAYYAPQLTIRGFSGPFESAFDEIREHMVEKQSDRVLSELQPMPLRADDFSTVGASHMASEFVDGDMHGPPVRHHEHDHADYLFWMLSSKSKWLPSAIRDMLVRGMAEWAVWRWHTATGYGRPLEDRGISGKLLRAMYEQEDPDWIPTGEARGDLLARSRIAIEDLGLPEAPEELADRMIEQRVIATFIEVESRRRAKG